MLILMLLITAFLAFAVAATGLNVGKLNLIALGLALWMLTVLLQRL